jgi:hypothetical protein
VLYSSHHLSLGLGGASENVCEEDLDNIKIVEFCVE